MGITLLKDRRLWLLGLLGVLAFVVARWSIPTDRAFHLVVKTGYWVMLATVLLFGRALWRLAKVDMAGWRPDRAEWWALGLVLATAGLWQAHEKHGFKILADEVLLLGTSMDLHYNREPTYPIRATDVQGPYQVLQSVLDKRPFFFPFVVGLVHDLTGYRSANPFYVNMVLSVVFLTLVYVLARRIGGSPWAGALGVLLFAGLPLMAQQAAGGGFELLNLVMLTGVMLLALRYAAKPDALAVETLCLAAVLLAQTRYESAIMILPVAIIVLWGWQRAGRVDLPATLWLLPVLLMPYVLQNRRFGSDAGLWELAGQGGGATEPFGLHYLPDNLGHALAFFFDTTGFQPNSLLFAGAGLLALPLFGIWITRVLRGEDHGNRQNVALVAMGLGLLAINALFMVYFWGQFDHPVIRRLSLPLHVCMMIAIVCVLTHWVRWRGKWHFACALAVLALLVQGLPVMAKRAYEKDYTPGVEMAWRQEFIDHHPARDFLFIDQDSIFWVTQRIPATPIKQAQLRKEGLAYHLRNHSFSAMYVFQRFKVNDQTGELVLDEADDVGPGFALEPVWEKRIATLLIGRISRITEITEEDGRVTAATEFVQSEKSETRTPEQIEKAKAEYLDYWIKQLP
ncbi:MAG: glycosyltransferase family 39 protein [Opitutaceae bacterium]|nr:glycosyltransferase family 39 protein [Opitutaceae bacterium]